MEDIFQILKVLQEIKHLRELMLADFFGVPVWLVSIIVVIITIFGLYKKVMH